MYNLYIKKAQNKLTAAVEKPFKTEDEFERYLINAKEIFSDIFIIKRQVNSGRDIPDVIGVDRDNNVVIIENKNVPVTEDILPQILRYAIWAETNPDSIKALWLETENRPDDVEIEWDNVNIRIIVLAPSIKLTVPRLLKKINYNVELIEVKRFLIGNEESVLLNRLEEEPGTKVRGARGLEVYNKEFYKTFRNNDSVDVFIEIADEIERMSKSAGWQLERKFNKYYVGFKFGFSNVFGVQWVGSRSLGLFFKMRLEEFNKIKPVSPYPMEYDKRWKQGTIKYSEDIKLSKLKRIFEMVYGLFIER